MEGLKFPFATKEHSFYLPQGSMAGTTPRKQGTYLLVKAVRSQVEVVEGDKVVFKEAQE